MKNTRTIYVCPVYSCVFLSMTPGKCRSHPYPCRAMGPELVPQEVLSANIVEQALADHSSTNVSPRKRDRKLYDTFGFRRMGVHEP